MNVYYVAESFADAMDKFRFAPIMVTVKRISNIISGSFYENLLL